MTNPGWLTARQTKYGLTFTATCGIIAGELANSLIAPGFFISGPQFNIFGIQGPLSFCWICLVRVGKLLPSYPNESGLCIFPQHKGACHVSQ